MAEQRGSFSQDELEAIKAEIEVIKASVDLPENGEPRIVHIFTPLKDLSPRQREIWARHLKIPDEMSPEQEEAYQELLNSLRNNP